MLGSGQQGGRDLTRHVDGAGCQQQRQPGRHLGCPEKVPGGQRGVLAALQVGAERSQQVTQKGGLCR